MCICCCFGFCCNSYSAKCLESNILVLSVICTISSIIPFTIIKLNHLSLTSKIFSIILCFSTLIDLLSISLIIYWRNKGTINKKNNSNADCLAKIAIMFCVLSLICSIFVENLIKNNLNKLNYPCSKYIYGINNIIDNSIILFSENPNEKFSEEEKKLCEKVQNNRYNTKICSETEYIINYLSPSIIQFCTFLLLIFWYYDIRRIKQKIDGIIDKNQEKFLRQQQIFGAQYDPNGIFIYGQQDGVNMRNFLGRHRFSQLNMNFSRNIGNNYIQNIRREFDLKSENDSSSRVSRNNNNIVIRQRNDLSSDRSESSINIFMRRNKGNINSGAKNKQKKNGKNQKQKNNDFGKNYFEENKSENLNEINEDFEKGENIENDNIYNYNIDNENYSESNNEKDSENNNEKKSENNSEKHSIVEIHEEKSVNDYIDGKKKEIEEREKNSSVDYENNVENECNNIKFENSKVSEKSIEDMDMHAVN